MTFLRPAIFKHLKTGHYKIEHIKLAIPENDNPKDDTFNYLQNFGSAQFQSGLELLNLFHNNFFFQQLFSENFPCFL